MNLQTWLRWLMRFVLPFTHWRVQVVLLRGHDRVSGREVALLCAGGKSATHYILKRLFAQEPTVERTARVPVWRLQRVLDEWRSAADLVVVGIDRISARLFLRRHYLAIPQWISSWMAVPADLNSFARKRKSTAADIRRVRIKNFECEFSQNPADLDLFFDKFYQPYIMTRHGDLSSLAPRWIIRNTFRRGMIQWVSQKGERLAGQIVRVNRTQYSMVVNGILDGRVELLQEGSLSALYVHSIEKAQSLGHAEILMGGSRSSLHDGVLRYKKKWASGFYPHEGCISANMVTLLSWDRFAGPVADFLSQTSIIHHDHSGFSALWAFPQDEPLTAENLRKHYNKLKAPGLRCLYILLPGEPPAGFACPANVCLIPLAEVSQGGEERLERWFQLERPPVVQRPPRSRKPW